MKCLRSITTTSIVALTITLLSVTPTHAWPPGGNGRGGGNGGGGNGGGGNTAPYTIIPFLPPDFETVSSGVSDLNEVGQAVGTAEIYNGLGGLRAVHLDVISGVYTELSDGSVARGVNNLNQTVGYVELPAETLDLLVTVALFWSSPSADPVELSPLPGDVDSYAYAINDAGIVVGSSVGSSNEQGVAWRVIVDAGGIVHVSDPVALPALADAAYWSAGDVGETVDGAAVALGGVTIDSIREAALWLLELDPVDGTIVVNESPVGLGPYSSGFATNTYGDVCGQYYALPFVALAGQGIQPLPLPRNTQWGRAMDVNNAGQVVGILDIYSNIRNGPGNFHAYLWTDGEMIDLEKQVDLGGWDRLSGANVINDVGVIAGWGRFDMDSRGFLLIPAQ